MIQGAPGLCNLLRQRALWASHAYIHCGDSFITIVSGQAQPKTVERYWEAPANNGELGGRAQDP